MQKLMQAIPFRYLNEDQRVAVRQWHTRFPLYTPPRTYDDVPVERHTRVVEEWSWYVNALGIAPCEKIGEASGPVQERPTVLEL